MTTTTTNSSRQLTLHKGELYEQVDTPFFIAHRKSSIPVSHSAPQTHWKGGLFPLELWDRIKAFFQKFSEHEAQVRLFYNSETSEWGAWAFPQLYGTGMTTEEIEEHERRDEGFARFPEHKGWVQMGTVHHHCKAGAFQSGTDSKDERQQVGLHITLGRMDHPVEFDIHGRVSIIFPGELDSQGHVIRASQQQFYEGVDFSEWFEAPAWINRSVPMPRKFLSEAVKHAITQRVPDDVAFPPEWEENLIIEQRGEGRRWDSRRYYFPNSTLNSPSTSAEMWDSLVAAGTGEEVNISYKDLFWSVFDHLSVSYPDIWDIIDLEDTHPLFPTFVRDLREQLSPTKATAGEFLDWASGLNEEGEEVEVVSYYEVLAEARERHSKNSKEPFSEWLKANAHLLVENPSDFIEWYYAANSNPRP